MALGDVAGHVDPAEEEWHPARILALERGEAVAGLLEADAKLLRQSVDIVPHRARGAAEAAIGHQQGARRVIAQADEEELPAGGAAQLGAFDHGGDLVLQRQRGKLVSKLEAAGFGGLAGIDGQVAHLGIVGAQARLPGIDQRDRQRAF